MKQLGDVLRQVNVGAFCLLAAACLRQWRRRDDASIRWATLAFGSLATISVIGLVLRADPTTHLAIWFVKTILVVLVLFPLFLYRFATAFRPAGRAVAALAYGTTAAIVIASLALPYVPYPGMAQPGWWTAYRIGILVQWTILFSIVAARLWVAARHEAAVVRRRMRTLAVAAAGLNAVVLLSGAGASRPSVTMIAVNQGLSLASAVLFFVGLAPPAWLLILWRRPDQLALQNAMGALFRAENVDDIAAVLLPRAVALVGGRGAALRSTSGEVLARHGATEGLLEIPADDMGEGAPAGGRSRELHRVKLSAGELVLWTSPYAPFFGPGEFTMLQSLGAFADIVVERCALADRHRRAEAALHHQATHDRLTSLPNRVLLEDRVQRALVRSRRTGGMVAVLFLDVDRFKVINDSLGHAVGDELLKTVAQRLEGVLRPEDTIARFGGDEFVIVTENNAPGSPEALAARIAEAVAAPTRIQGTDVIATVSIGVALGDGAYDAGALLRDADAAMYQAKEQGRDRCVLFDGAMRDAADQRLRTETALRRALDGGELRVHYQPMVSLPSGRIAGVEALVRWQKDEHTLILPNDFIPVAEETGLIINLGAVVLREACRQVAEWRRDVAGLAQLTLSVNLSARELLNPGVVEQVREALVSSGVEPHALCLEITESVLLDDTDSCARSLEALRTLGVRIGVDDFGTGYSSLTYLKRLAVDTLKIDQSFVAGLHHDASSREDRAIVAGIVDLAHAFGLTTVAEGVETAEQLAELSALGCEQAQGYHFCRPVSPADLLAWALERVAEDASLAPVDAGPAAPGTRRVLLVDDEASMRRLFRWALEDDTEFCVIAEAVDGREAVALARHHQPDVVLLDLAMPGVGGLEALPLIRAVAPMARVVVISGLEPDDVADKAAHQGAVGFIVKGSDPASLADDLRCVLRAPAHARAGASGGSTPPGGKGRAAAGVQ
ncbi:MAG TPA: EAL domain-containing protein [Acidimicrobiales bacterium]|nr:EAL domain-containing protein [Acidimicrobiales bacterium]